MESIFNELALKSSLDCFWHLAHNMVDLQEIYVFGSIVKFQHMVATNEAHMLYLITRIIAYNISTHFKILTEYSKWKQICWDYNKQVCDLSKKRNNIEKKLYQSQKNYIEMQHSNKKLKNNVLLMKASVKTLNY